MKLIYYNLLFILVTLTSCSNAQKNNDQIPVHDEFTIESKQVGETRNINVWTPPEYKSSTDSLPVMYMADGGIIDEDFPHIANTLAELIKTKKIPPMILVGIANTQRRRDLTGPTQVAKDKEIFVSQKIDQIKNEFSSRVTRVSIRPINLNDVFLWVNT